MKKVVKKSADYVNSEVFYKKKIRNLHVRGRYFFLTIPHFDKLKETYNMIELSSKELLIEKFAVVLETHTNDLNKSKHIHVFVQLTKRRQIGLTFFDYLGKRGNLQNVRNINAVLQYMNKENVCKANFDVWESLLENPRTFANTIRRMMLSGWTQQALFRTYGKTFGTKPWQTALRLGSQALAAEQSGLDRPTKQMRKITRALIESRLDQEELRLFDSLPLFRVFVDFVNKILQHGNQQLHKQCCLALVGEPSIGKTTVLNKLKQFFHTYVFPLDGWHTQYENGVYEIILWNEWDTKLMSRSDLLLFTEGEIVDLKVKYTKAVKTDRPMILLTANQTYRTQISSRFGYAPELSAMFIKALDVRLVELNFGKQHIWFLTKLFVAVTEDI